MVKIWMYIEDDEDDLTVQHGGPWVLKVCSTVKEALEIVEFAEQNSNWPGEIIEGRRKEVIYANKN